MVISQEITMLATTTLDVGAFDVKQVFAVKDERRGNNILKRRAAEKPKTAASRNALGLIDLIAFVKR